MSDIQFERLIVEGRRKPDGTVKQDTRYYEYHSEDFALLIEQAKRKVKDDHSHHSNHQWTKAVLISSYGSDLYDIEVYVLEGSPVKGVVIANWGVGVIRGFASNMDPILKYKVHPHAPQRDKQCKV